MKEAISLQVLVPHIQILFQPIADKVPRVCHTWVAPKIQIASGDDTSLHKYFILPPFQFVSPTFRLSPFFKKMTLPFYGNSLIINFHKACLRPQV